MKKTIIFIACLAVYWACIILNFFIFKNALGSAFMGICGAAVPILAATVTSITIKVINKEEKKDA